MTKMQKHILFVLFVAAAMLAPPVISTVLGSDRTGRGGPTAVVMAPDDDDDDAMVESATGGADVRVVVAAPRAALLGHAAEVLVAPRRGRTVNVVMGETIRFVSGVREAVWYAGDGAVDSSLAVFEAVPGLRPSLLGRDRILLGGAAPKIDSGRARVDVSFAGVGPHDVDAVVTVAAGPRHGRGALDTERVRYRVQVWNAGELGGITGTVVIEGDGTPLPGMRVVALDAATRGLAAADTSGCDGTYDLRRLPPGDYLVAVRGRRGFIGQFFNNAPDPNSASPVSVGAGATTSSVDFLLSHN